MVKHDYEELQNLIAKETPGPGQYNNFCVFQDKSKSRASTMGKRFSSAKAKPAPGPGSYTTRGNKFSTHGGAGSTTGQRWTFGSEPREINKDVTRRASKIPGCTDYSPKNHQKKGRIPISFGRKLLYALSKDHPGPGNYSPDTLNIQTQVRRKLQISRPVGPPKLRLKLC